MQFYTDITRESDPHALPDAEVFDVTNQDIFNQRFDAGFISDEGWMDTPGVYYWFCQPGCLPDSDPIGPFETEALAIADARE